MSTLVAARARPLTTLAVIAGVVIFLLLLGGNAGVAVLVSLLVVPAAILFYLTRLDLYEREPWALLASVIGAGALVGLLSGLLSTFFFERFWFSDSRLNLGSIGFTGIAATGEGSVPFGVVLLSGILIPVLTGVAILGGPIALRRWPVFRNEITDGMTLGGLAAAGFATVSSFVYFWPSAFDDLPDRPVSQWTALLAGIVVIRPVVLILAGSLLGIAAWQYLSTKDIRAVLVTGVAGIFGWFALPLGSLLLAQSGAVTEFLWYAVVLIIVGVLFRQALNRSLATDQQVLTPADGEQRVVCPNCHRVTPDGSFCSFCRAPLHPEAPVALESAPSIHPLPRDPRVQSPTDEIVESGAAGPVSSAQRPVMAREHQSSEDAHGGDRAMDPADDDDHGWLDEVAAEPEADALDYLDRPPSRTSSVDRTAGPAGPVPPSESPPSDEALLAAARFERSPTGDQAPARPETTSVAESDVVDPYEGIVEPTPTGQSEGPARPLSLQDWSRRSEPNPVPGVTDGSDERDPEPPSSSTTRPASPWNRPVDAEPEVTSGLKWPTSAATASIDRLSDVTMELPGADMPKAPFDRDQPVSQQEQRPVASSSGRWFDASTSLGDSAPIPSTPGTGEERSDDRAPSPNESTAMTTEAEPIPDVASEPTEAIVETNPSDERTLPSGLRWYRQDDEDEHLDEPPAAFEAEPPADTRELDSNRTVPSRPVASTSDAEATSGTAGRPGIWRSLTRQGRGGTPRAPQRDQSRTDDEG